MRLFRLTSESVTVALSQLGKLVNATGPDHRISIPAMEMPMFVRGLYEGLTGVQSGALPIPYWPDAKQITIFSDYSDKFGDWTTYAFLCSPSEKFDELATTLLDLRKCHNLEDGRRFEYKSMRDKKRWSAISDWLDAFDMLTGLVVVLLVHKDVVSVFYANADNELDQLTKSIGKWGFGDWGTTR